MGGVSNDSNNVRQTTHRRLGEKKNYHRSLTEREAKRKWLSRKSQDWGVNILQTTRPKTAATAQIRQEGVKGGENEDLKKIWA